MFGPFNITASQLRINAFIFKKGDNLALTAQKDFLIDVIFYLAGYKQFFKKQD